MWWRLSNQLGGLRTSYINLKVLSLRIDAKSMFKGNMITMFTKENQIANTIITLDSISMVDNLPWNKISANHLFHNQPMLKHITLFLRKRMLWIPNKNISISINNPPPLTIISSSISTFLRTIFFIFTFIHYKAFAAFQTIHRFIANIIFTFFTTKSTDRTFWYFKDFSTISTHTFFRSKFMKTNSRTENVFVRSFWVKFFPTFFTNIHWSNYTLPTEIKQDVREIKSAINKL